MIEPSENIDVVKSVCSALNAKHQRDVEKRNELSVRKPETWQSAQCWDCIYEDTGRCRRFPAVAPCSNGRTAYPIVISGGVSNKACAEYRSWYEDSKQQQENH